MSQNAMAYDELPYKQPQRGHIELVMGCMFAGKSTELLRRADTRYAVQGITTHNNEKADAIGVIKLSELKDLWKPYDVIGIDEGQFFTDIVEFAEEFANHGKIVIISSLSGTFLRGSWQNIIALIPKCEKVKKLSAVCKICKQSASFTFRTAPPECKNLIGGEESYVPLCRQCHLAQSQLQQFEGNPESMDQDIDTFKKDHESNVNQQDTNLSPDDSLASQEDIQKSNEKDNRQNSSSPESPTHFDLSINTPISSMGSSMNSPDQLSE